MPPPDKGSDQAERSRKKKNTLGQEKEEKQKNTQG